MSFNRYFHDELSALRELGREFSLKNPKLAPFLAEEAQDPDVERLLEGVAFISGRLRQKLDDELPELTHSLMALLWPVFLRPVPAMSILQFTPLITLSEQQKVARGVSVESVPVDGTPCTFRTCYDVDINPLEISRLVKHDRPKGTLLRLELTLTAPLLVTELNLENLRFYLHGETHVAQHLYLWLFRYLSEIRLLLHDQEENDHYVTTLSSAAIKPVGLADSENLMPACEQVFRGYPLLQEYFALPEKFHFVEFTQLDVLTSYCRRHRHLDRASKIIIELEFSRPLDNYINIKADNFRLHCTPIINLVNHTAAPIHMDHRKTEYRVLPLGSQPDHYEIYSVDKVEGWGHSTREYLEYKRFESFEHAQNVDAFGGGRYYRERLKASMSGHGVDTFLAFVDAAEQQLVPQTETVSIELTCSNRHLPTQLAVGDIHVDTGSSPEYASFENIVPVTPSFTPPLDKGFHWRLIANMSLNFTTLSDLKTLRAMLSTYDYRSYYDRQQARASQFRLQGLERICTQPCERLHHGVPIRGMKTQLEVKESCFSNEGDMFVFLTVLNEFFALYASINSFHELEAKGIENGEDYRWSPRIGLQPLL